MTKPILCVGALTCDLVLQVPVLPSARGKHLAGRSTLIAAGMAASAATAIARFEQPVALWASIRKRRCL
jgi:sulfofructose kinase